METRDQTAAGRLSGWLSVLLPFARVWLASAPVLLVMCLPAVDAQAGAMSILADSPPAQRLLTVRGSALAFEWVAAESIAHHKPGAIWLAGPAGGPDGEAGRILDLAFGAWSSPGDGWGIEMDGGGLAVIGRLEDGDWRTRALNELAVAVRGNLPDLEDVDLPLVDASPVAAARASVLATAGVRTPDPGPAVSDSAGLSTAAPP